MRPGAAGIRNHGRQHSDRRPAPGHPARPAGCPPREYIKPTKARVASARAGSAGEGCNGMASRQASRGELPRSPGHPTSQRCASSGHHAPTPMLPKGVAAGRLRDATRPDYATLKRPLVSKASQPALARKARHHDEAEGRHRRYHDSGRAPGTPPDAALASARSLIRALRAACPCRHARPPCVRGRPSQAPEARVSPTPHLVVHVLLVLRHLLRVLEHLVPRRRVESLELALQHHVLVLAGKGRPNHCR